MASYYVFYYIDDLLLSLKSSGVGCYMGNFWRISLCRWYCTSCTQC